MELLTTTLNLIKALVSSGASDTQMSMALFQLSIELFLIGTIYSRIGGQNGNRLLSGLMNRIEGDTPDTDMDRLNWRRICFVTLIVSLISMVTSSCLWLPFITNLDERCIFMANYLIMNFERFGFSKQSKVLQGLRTVGPEMIQYGIPMGLLLMAVNNFWVKLANVQTIVLVEKGSKVFIVSPMQNDGQGFPAIENISGGNEEQRTIQN